MKKRVLLRAPVFTSSGYGVHSRQVAKYLLDKHDNGDIELFIRALPWGITSWILDKGAANGLVGRLMQRTGNVTEPCDVSVQVQLPNEWDSKLAHTNIGVTAGVETDKCNPKWIDCVDTMDHVIVPSTFIKTCFLNSGTPKTNITVIPESYNEAIPECTESLNVNLNTNFNFLIFGQITGNNKDNDRKNIFYTIKWLCEVFKDDPDVGIVLKTNMGKNTKIDRLNVKNTFVKILTEVRKTQYPKFHLLHGNMLDTEVAQLFNHNTIKAFVLLSRGEGYCLPMVDAAASGVPVVAIPLSGYMDFMKVGKFIKVDFELKDIHKTRIDNKIFMSGVQWGEASEEDFKRKISKFRKNYKIPQEWANDLKIKVLKDLSFDAVSRIYDDFFSGIL